jgi:hypothetical protein
MTDVALVAWAKERGLFVRICRPGVWGNPFVLGADGDRDVVIESYRLFIARKHGLLRKLGELRGKVLGCYCYPEPCHGDILAGMAQDAKGAHEHDAP